MKSLILFFNLFYALVSMATSNHTFENKVQAIEKRRSFYSQPLLFVGSSTIELWKSVEKKFSAYEALNYGISGSQFSDLLYFNQRLFLKHNPRAIVIYSGDNDLASGKSVDKVAKNFKELVSEIRAEQYQKIFLIGVKQSLRRIEKRDKVIELNKKLKNICKSMSHVFFLDLDSQITDAQGWPDKKYFASDLLHLSEAGYLVLDKILSQELSLHPDLK